MTFPAIFGQRRQNTAVTLLCHCSEQGQIEHSKASESFVVMVGRCMIFLMWSL